MYLFSHLFISVSEIYCISTKILFEKKSSFNCDFFVLNISTSGKDYCHKAHQNRYLFILISGIECEIINDELLLTHVSNTAASPVCGL